MVSWVAPPGSSSPGGGGAWGQQGEDRGGAGQVDRGAPTQPSNGFHTGTSTTSPISKTWSILGWKQLNKLLKTIILVTNHDITTNKFLDPFYLYDSVWDQNSKRQSHDQNRAQGLRYIILWQRKDSYS